MHGAAARTRQFDVDRERTAHRSRIDQTKIRSGIQACGSPGKLMSTGLCTVSVDKARPLTRMLILRRLQLLMLCRIVPRRTTMSAHGHATYRTGGLGKSFFRGRPA